MECFYNGNFFVEWSTLNRTYYSMRSLLRKNALWKLYAPKILKIMGANSSLLKKQYEAQFINESHGIKDACATKNPFCLTLMDGEFKWNVYPQRFI